MRGVNLCSQDITWKPTDRYGKAMGRFNVLLVLVSLAIVRAEWPAKEFVEKIRPAVEKCEEDTGVDKSLVEQFTRGDSMVDDPKLKCYMKCIFTELDLLDEETGVFRYLRMLNLLPEEMKSTVYDMGVNCIHFKGEHGSDHCQVSYDLHRCWQKNDPEHYFLL